MQRRLYCNAHTYDVDQFLCRHNCIIDVSPTPDDSSMLNFFLKALQSDHNGVKLVSFE